jgi:hypothetical protein
MAAPPSPIGPRPAWLRALHWKHSGWVISLIFACGFALVLADKFAFAYLCLAISMLWSIGSWLSSDTIEKRRPRQRRATKRTPIPPPITKADIRRYRIWRFGPVAGILFLFLCLFLWTRSLQVEKELASLGGWIYPANDPTPANPCSESPLIGKSGAFILLLGRLTSGVVEFPRTVLSVNGKSALVVDRRADGAIFVRADIIGPDGKLIVRLDDSGYTVNGNNVLTWSRSDRSSLQVTDQYGNKISARYLNRNAFKLSAVLQYPGARPLTITEPDPNGMCVSSVGSSDYSIVTSSN